MKKISLLLAILININIVVGGAFFFGCGKIAKIGALAPAVWLVVGALLFPLVYILSKLAQKFPVAGGIYIYSEKLIGPSWGLVSSWSYFVGTAAGNALILSAFSRGLFNAGGALWLDIFCVIIFTLATLFNIEILEKAQLIFTTLKVIPFAVLAIGALLLFNSSGFKTELLNSSYALETVPLIFFAFIGIEACCSMAHIIEEKSAHKAILISFALIISVYVFAQFLLMGVSGGDVASFETVTQKIAPNNMFLQNIVWFSILSSFLGGFYSMFYANSWNLYAMVNKKYLNSFGSPYIAIIAQAILIIFFLIITKYSRDTLSIMSDLGVLIAYMLSVVAFWKIAENKLSKILVVVALLALLLMLSFFMKALQ